MKQTRILLMGVALAALSSCTAPYGNGTQQMVPRANVEEVENRGALPPAPSNAASSRNAVDYGLDNRYGNFYGRGGRYY